MTLSLRYAVRSDRGLVRTNNEDSVFAGPRLLALADGMGGHAAGEVASQLMISACAPLDDDEPAADLLDQLHNAMDVGNKLIHDEAAAHPELSGMGTTLTAMLFNDTKMGLCHVGDSRAYLLRDGKLSQITRDDTYVQSLVDQGSITREEAQVHPQRSLIMRALTGEPIEPTLTIREVSAGDRYLICSDGLSDPVRDETIEEAMKTSLTADDCADRLVDLALRSGGPDNVTVIVADVIDHGLGSTQPVFGGAAAQLNDELPRPDTAAGRVAAPRIASTTRVVEGAPEPHRPLVTRRAGIMTILAFLIVLIAGCAGLRTLWVHSFYVGSDLTSGHVAIYRGIRHSVPILPAPDEYAKICIEENSVVVNRTGDTEPCINLVMSDLHQDAQNELSSDKSFHSYDDVRDYALRALSNSLLPICIQGTDRTGGNHGSAPSAHSVEEHSTSPSLPTSNQNSTSTATPAQAATTAPAPSQQREGEQGSPELSSLDAPAQGEGVFPQRASSHLTESDLPSSAHEVPICRIPHGG